MAWFFLDGRMPLGALGVSEQASHPATARQHRLFIVGHLAVISYLAGTGELGVCWHPGGLAAALGAGICMALGLLYFFKALAAGPPAGVVVPLTALYPPGYGDPELDFAPRGLQPAPVGRGGSGPAGCLANGQIEGDACRKDPRRLKFSASGMHRPRYWEDKPCNGYHFTGIGSVGPAKPDFLYQV